MTTNATEVVSLPVPCILPAIGPYKRTVTLAIVLEILTLVVALLTLTTTAHPDAIAMVLAVHPVAHVN